MRYELANSHMEAALSELQGLVLAVDPDVCVEGCCVAGPAP